MIFEMWLPCGSLKVVPMCTAAREVVLYPCDLTIVNTGVDIYIYIYNLYIYYNIYTIIHIIYIYYLKYAYTHI